MSDIAERVQKIVVEHLGVDDSKVIENASFIDDLGADSLDTVELVMAFEEEFGCEIPDDAAEKMLPENMEQVDARDIIERAIKMFQRMAGDNEVNLTYEIDDDFPHLRTDSTRLNQVLISLMSDAIEHTPPGGIVNIDALLDPGGEAIILVIHDFGLGLPKEKLRQTLKPFDFEKDVEQSGENISLSIANRLMKELDGEMTLSSQEDTGTLISLSFPIELTSNNPNLEDQKNLTYPFSG